MLNNWYWSEVSLQPLWSRDTVCFVIARDDKNPMPCALVVADEDTSQPFQEILPAQVPLEVLPQVHTAIIKLFIIIE